MVVPEVLTEILGGSFEGAHRIALRHVRRSRFRWLVLVELVLFCAAFLCLLPVAVVAAVVLGVDELPIPELKGRFFYHWHEVEVEVLGADGARLHRVAFTPGGSEEGQAAVAAVLAAADANGLVVIETIRAGAVTPVEVWFGGQPLLAHPEARHEERAAGLLALGGLEVEDGGDVVTVTRGEAPTGRLVAWVRLLLLWPFAVWTARGRADLAEAWLDARGVGPGREVVEVRADGLAARRLRDDRPTWEQVVDGGDLLGLTYSATLGYDRDVGVRPPSLRLVGRNHTAALPLRVAGQSGEALRDFLVGTTLRLRAQRPELGLATAEARPTRCPYCGTMHVIAVGQRCPSCGAYAGNVA